MKAYYLDKAAGDQQTPPLDENSTPVDVNTLQMSGIEYRFIPVDMDGNWEQVGRSPGTGGGGTKTSCERRSIRFARIDPTKIEM